LSINRGVKICVKNNRTFSEKFRRTINLVSLGYESCETFRRFSYLARDLLAVAKVQEGLAVASIARDDRSTLPGDDPSPRARMHRDHNAR